MKQCRNRHCFFYYSLFRRGSRNGFRFGLGLVFDGLYHFLNGILIHTAVSSEAVGLLESLHRL